MKKDLHFEITFSEYNCPGVFGMNDEEIKECAIEYIKIEKASEVSSITGKWFANILGRNGEGIVIAVTFHYDESVN